MFKKAFVIFIVSFAQITQAKVTAAAVNAAYEAYLADKKYLLYIARHAHTDKISAWGKLTLTEDMVWILLENPHDMQMMGELLRGEAKYWGKNERFRNYHLDSFFLDTDWRMQKIFKSIVQKTQELQRLGGYVDRVEGQDKKFFDKRGNEIFLQQESNKRGVNCVASTGEAACKLLREGFVGYDKNLTTAEQSILNYFEDNVESLQGVGIKIAHMAEELGLDSRRLGRSKVKIEKKLAEDRFIRNIKMLQLSDGKFYYRLMYGKLYFVEQRIIEYLENNIAALEGEGIEVGKMAAEFGLSRNALGSVIRSLKKKLNADHFIQKISYSSSGYYHFHKKNKITIRQQMISHFEKNTAALQGAGININSMAEEIGTSPKYLYTLLRTMQDKFDHDHLTSKIKIEQGYFRFLDGNEKRIKLARGMEQEIIAYLKDNLTLLEGKGIEATVMATELDVNPQSLGWAIKRLQQQRSANHFVKQIGKTYHRGKTHYRFRRE